MKYKLESNYNCKKCGLFEKAKNPVVSYQGDVNWKILFIDECPNASVDRDIKERFFRGSIGEELRSIELKYKMKNTLRGFAYQCYNGGSSSEIYAKCCRSKLKKMIKELRPTCIVSLGEIATNSLLGTVNKVGIERLRGRVIPSHEFNCLIMPTFTSKEFRKKDENGEWKENYSRKEAFKLDITKFLNLYFDVYHKRFAIEQFLKRRDIFKNKKIHQIKTVKEFMQLCDNLEELKFFAFDYETTNTKPYDDYFEVISLCFAHESEAWVIYLPEYFSDITYLKRKVLSLFKNTNILKLIQNKQFEELATRWWCRDVLCGYERDDLNQVIKNYYDTMLASHVVDEREGTTGLDFQSLVRFGIKSFYDENKMDRYLKLRNKDDKQNHIKECPKETLIEYTGRDGIETFHNWKALTHLQTESDKYPYCIDFISKVCDVFANMSERGIPIDRKFLLKEEIKFENIQDKLQSKIDNDKQIIEFEKSKGKKLNVQSPKQMRDFLYNYLKLAPIKKTKGGKKGIIEESTDQSVINHHAEIDNIPFCKMAVKKKKIKKGLDVLKSIKRYTNEDNKIHPSFWMNTTATMRSSSSDLNFHNVPVHGFIIEDEDYKIPWEEIRQCFIRENQQYIIVEVDFERNEVVGAANLSKDKQLIKDINENFDMHSHWTNVIFGWNHPFEDYKSNKELHDYRYLTKNNWTFANFYKAGNKSIAESFRKFPVYTEFLQKEYDKKKRVDNFKDWMIIRSEDHIKECQTYFYDRYNRFKSWQDEQIEFYNQNGYVETPLGFRRHYPLMTTEIVNFPIQATSYHILADANIRIEKRFLKEGFKTELGGQIHDSLWIMACLDEILEVITLVDYEMTHHNLPEVNKLAKLGTEFSVGVNWGTMKKISSLKIKG